MLRAFTVAYDERYLFDWVDAMKNATSDLTGLILAGGKSRRFGSDKARFEVAGRAMIEHVIEVVAVVADPLLISVAEETVGFEAWGIPQVVDQYKDAGPLAGLHAGLLAAETPWVLAVTCDVPFLTHEVLHTLLEARGPSADVVAARTPDGRTHPLCACYRKTLLPVIETQLEEKTLALHALLDRIKNVTFVDLPAGPLRNVNRIADLDRSAENMN